MPGVWLGLFFVLGLALGSRGFLLGSPNAAAVYAVSSGGRRGGFSFVWGYLIRVMFLASHGFSSTS